MFLFSPKKSKQGFYKTSNAPHKTDNKGEVEHSKARLPFRMHF